MTIWTDFLFSIVKSSFIYNPLLSFGENIRVRVLDRGANSRTRRIGSGLPVGVHYVFTKDDYNFRARKIRAQLGNLARSRVVPRPIRANHVY